MLFCSCPLRDQTACSERRRQTIVPVCSYEEKLKPNCLELQAACKDNYICRSRLADFFANCQPEPRSSTGCLKENYADCLLAYSGLIGTVMTPNYLRSPKISVSPYCNCSNSGNNKDECDKFTEFFTENTCLRTVNTEAGPGVDLESNASQAPATVSAHITEATAVDAGPPLPLLFPQSTSSLYTPADPPALPVNVSDDAQRLEEVNVEGVVRVPSEEQECADPGPVSQSQGELRDSADENSDYLDEDMSGEDFLSSSQKRRSIDNSQGSDKSVKVRSKKDSHCPSADTFFFCSGVDSTQLLVLNSFCRTRRE
uniref:GDNF/GAS1 domain-containing protein n=1 Tax=Neogobius melanostomus TaxID=47308 RepID=A0A8C6V3D8_9GOBI